MRSPRAAEKRRIGIEIRPKVRKPFQTEVAMYASPSLWLSLTKLVIPSLPAQAGAAEGPAFRFVGRFQPCHHGTKKKLFLPNRSRPLFLGPVLRARPAGRGVFFCL